MANSVPLSEEEDVAADIRENHKQLFSWIYGQTLDLIDLQTMQ